MTRDALADWLAHAAPPFPDTAPEDVPDTVLEPLLDMIGTSRVVALGESMHRTHEFLAWRNRILRFLVEQAGFTAVVLESGFPEGMLVDRWVRSGEGRLRPVLDDGVTYHFGKCQETLDLVTWLREQRVTGRAPVGFYGMDIPDSAASPLPALRATVDVLGKVDPAYAEHVRSTLLAAHDFLPADRTGLARAATGIQSYLALDIARRHAITASVAALAERVRAMAPEYASHGVDQRDIDVAVRAADVARGADAFLAAMLDGPTRTWAPANIRDATMADTVEWILRREERVLIFAANGHIRKTPYLAPPFVTQAMTTLGGHLHARLGDDYRVIGTTFGGGEAWLHRPAADDPPGHSTPFTEELPAPRTGTLDAVCREAGLGSLLIDLRTAPGAVDSLIGTHNGPEVELADLRASYDAMLHVDRITPWHTWIDEHGRWDRASR